MSRRLGRRLIVIVAFFIAPAGYIALRALHDPRVPFLPPSVAAEWIVVPGPLPFAAGPASTRAHMRREFQIDDVPGHLELRLRAFETAIVEMNGSLVPAVAASTNWKRPSRYDIGPYLRRGTNVVRVDVRGPHIVTALLVEAPPALRTPSGWIPTSEFAAPVAPIDRFGFGLMPVAPGPLQQWHGWRWARWVVIVWLGLICTAAVTAAVTSLRAASVTRSLSTPRRGGDWLNALVLAAIFSTCAWINVTNAARFPSGRTPFDARAHKDYIERVEQTWRPPVATDGFEMYQPPLYYFVAALADLTHGRGKDELDEFKGAQYLGCISGIALAFLTWLTLRWDAPHDRVAQWIGTTFVAFLPMSLYMNVLVTNEVFAAAITAGAFYTVLRWLSTNALDVRRAASAGLANGAALLAKFTAVFALGSAAVVLALHLTRGKLRRLAGALATFAAAAILVCGWYYLRNAVLFGHPFVGNWDDASGFRYEQVPGYRTLAFYTRFGEVLFTHPRSAPGISWLDAHYGSMWADTYGTFFPPTDDRAYFWSQVQMIAALFPTMIMVVGFIATVASAMRRPWRDRDVLVAAFPLFTWAALVSFSMDVPAYSTVKAPFFLATVPCLALFLARGRHLLGVHCRPLRGALDVTVLSLSILSIALYRYSGG